MDKQFASQLANLQRVASRAGGTEGPADEARRRTDDRHRSDRPNHYSRDGGRDNYHRDRDNRDGGRRYDSRRDDYHDRKRRRDEDDWRRRDRRPGRGYGGRQYDRDRYDRNDRYDRRREEPHVPMADLVKNVAALYVKNQNSQPVKSTENDVGKRRHIALLFLTIDDLPHEHVWKEWLRNTNAPDEDGTPGTESADSSEKILVSVLCHAKFPERITSPWLRQRHLIRFQRSTDKEREGNDRQEQQQPPRMHTRRPDWGTVEITRAMIDLLDEGLRIGSTKEGDVKNETADADGSAKTTGEPTKTWNRETSYQRYLSTPDDALPEADANTDKSYHTDDDIPPVDRFIFLSESCLPVATLKEVEMALFGPKITQSNDDPTKSDDNNKKINPYNKSWLNVRSTPNNGYSRQLQWDEIRSHDIPQTLIWKADQWIVLNRKHGEAVASIPQYLNGKSLWYAFRKCRASDEMYFPTALAILGLLSRPPDGNEVEDESNESSAGNEIRKRKITYCDWSASAKNPASFTSKDWVEVAEKARKEGCLFARKFVKNSREEGGGIVLVDDWKTLMQKVAMK